jgi:hypothetical protein
MKLSIEELAREAGFTPLGRQAWDGFDANFEAFARLIVERCAVECDALWQEDGTAIDCRDAIRQLLEDK